MDKSNLLYVVKNNKWIYSTYYFAGTTLIKVLKCFIRPRKKKILFISFGGKKFDDSPKSIFDAMKNDSRFDDCEIYWALNNPDFFEVKGAHKIKTDTLQYFITALKCGIWITNSSAERGLSLKSKKTYCLNTWHGTPIKKIGPDSRKDTVQFKTRSKIKDNLILVQSDFDNKIMQRVFGLPEDHFATIGYPRNDNLLKYSGRDVERIKKNLNIPNNKKVILYAPTFREYELEGNRCYFNLPFDFEQWEKKLEKDYVVLVRAHYEIGKLIGMRKSNSIVNVSDYQPLNDLMAISDILVSDYSSIFFDFSILHRPMLCYTYDYEIYEKKRGVYFDIRDWLSNSNSDFELLDNIINIDWEKEKQKCIRFQREFVTEYGDASQRVLDILASKII